MKQLPLVKRLLLDLLETFVASVVLAFVVGATLYGLIRLIVFLLL